jgi:acetyl-CoA synthetase
MTDENTPAAIEVVLDELRTFPPSASFKKDALVVDTHIYDEANRDFEGFWARQAADLLTWHREWDTILTWDLAGPM